VSVLAHAEEGDHVPAITLGRIFSAWTLEWVAVVLILVTAALYLVGVRRLHARGDRWPLVRTLSFCGLGLGTLIVASCSSVATYDTTLLSMHMAQHMLFSMVAPIFMALGAPVTLALRTLPSRGRSVLLRVLHTRVAAIVASPPVAFTLFVASPWVLYFSGLYEATLRSPVLHDLVHLHFVIVGCLFFWPLLGLDPVPGRVAYPFRMLMVFATLPFHAFLGVTILSMDELIASDWYSSLDRHWPPTPIDDQHIAGSILWGSGDVVGLVIFAVLFVQWVRASQREAEREDRRLDREEAAERRAASPR
jgi:putative copper resistance protein D